MSGGAVHYWPATGVPAATLFAWAADDLTKPSDTRPRAIFVHAHPHGEPCAFGCRELVSELERRPNELVRDVNTRGRL